MIPPAQPASAASSSDLDEPGLAIEISSVTRQFMRNGEPFTAIRDVNLEVNLGEFLSVVGPSGCGKSTLLNLVAGLAVPEAGVVKTFGKKVSGVSRDVGFIFQRDALLPWRTAVQNVALPLRYRGKSRKEADNTAREWLDRVGLTKFADSYPSQLSGGMRKRVAIAATLAYQPSIILMDEPFSALDVQTRMIMEDDLLNLWATYRPAVLFITHDLEEAVGLSDRVVVMSASPGRVIGDHQVPLERPRDLLDVRFEQKFTETHEQIWSQLRTEVEQARVN
ncbi:MULTISPECIES: ABC transporter ATP-binding protein [Actinomycetes]|uniref:ABC transporter ATP-binding protein n=1 Tax=Actinomycetes TaxID=1760 RepID=UPI000AC2BA75|nr:MULTISPECIES: ABC transporter ATP-binding protein [Actinomycetes]